MRNAVMLMVSLVLAVSVSRAQTTFDPNPETRGLLGEATETAGQVFGLYGVTTSPDPGSAGLLAASTATSGEVFGLVGTTASPTGAAGFFTSLGGGPILRGVADGVTVFEVSATGEVTAGLLVGDGMALGPLGDVDCSGCIQGSQIADGAVTTIKIAAGAVGSEELAVDAVTAADIALHVVQAQHLADGIVSNSKIADGSVVGVDIALNTLGASELAQGAITAAKLAPDAVRRSHLDGSERLLYSTHDNCGNRFVLTFETTCASLGCGAGNFLDCNNGCTRTSPALCLNPEYGYLLSPDIHPF